MLTSASLMASCFGFFFFNINLLNAQSKHFRELSFTFVLHSMGCLPGHLSSFLGLG